MMWWMWTVACQTQQQAPSSQTVEAEQSWTCPMHPEIVRDQPGSCPVCGMDLVQSDRGPQITSQVHVHPGIVQQIGVETAPVERTTVFRHIRTVGEVEVGEDALRVVNLRFSGWVEKVYVDRTGDEVEKGQALFEIYSPELVAAQEQYLLALRTQGAEAPLTRSARRKLELWDLSTRDIQRLETKDEVSRTLVIRSPHKGFVLHKDLVEGGRVQAGHDLYRIGNLQRIWVKAEVYEHDAPWVEVDQPAQLEVTPLPGQVVEGKVSYIYPTLNSQSRTLSIRLEFDNPGVRLKPGMFATVYIQYRRADDVVAVPTEAILHSGRRQVVFLAVGGGHFEPREVTTGLVGDHRMTEITHGLAEGDLVVTSGQFLIDSESQLNEALAKVDSPVVGNTIWTCPMHPEVMSQQPGQCPECGMDLEEKQGQVDPVTAQPGQYTCPMHPEVISDEAGRCPDCGMFLERVVEP